MGTAGPGSAGATTLALAVAAVCGGAVIEAGADGGVLAARCDLSLHAGAPGLDSLVAATSGPLRVLDHVQRCAGGVPVVVAAATEETVAGALRSLAAALPGLRTQAEVPLVVDVGRVRQTTAALLGSCDGLVLVTGASREELACALLRLPGLFLWARRIVLAVHGPGPYALADVRRLVAEQVGAVAVPVVGIPDDPRGADALVEGTRRRRPSPLLRAAAQLLDCCAAADADDLVAGRTR
ncbi:hypothetical protein [Frankia gtarii]|uniref:hypothetical protein n=1 Tax=Frankia gtarii TaxID=2950102 RepID=UPI0021C14D37|nr:hypothetical protein [Frankia gtarii]